MLEVGFVLRAHGVRGVLRVRATGATLETARRLFVDGSWHAVEWAQRERAEWLVKLEGIDDRDRAGSLRGKALAIDEAERPAAEDDEVYVADLVGCRVVDREGRALGEVTGSFDSGAHEVLEVRGAREFMLPFVDAMVVSVDVAGKTIVCDPPPGLVDPDEAE
jgi:16S rRNA processing protein RimM